MMTQLTNMLMSTHLTSIAVNRIQAAISIRNNIASQNSYVSWQG